MRSITLAVAGLATLVLAACNPTTPQVTGSFEGDWSDVDGPVRLALVGYTESGYQVNDDQPQLASTETFESYTVSLPPSAPEGRYVVAAYEDANDDGRMDLGEERGDSADAYLYYSEDGSGEYEPGWNGQTGLTGEPQQRSLYSDYDIAR